jgi:hypothetical protein
MNRDMNSREARELAMRERETASSLLQAYEDSQALRAEASSLNDEVSQLKALCHKLVKDEDERTRKRRENTSFECPIC